MFELYNKKEKKKEWIYAVIDDNHGYPLFLVRHPNQWIWLSAKHYIPIEEYLQSLENPVIEHCNVNGLECNGCKPCCEHKNM